MTAPPPTGRDPYFDNAKFLAIVLVVIGHAYEPLRGAGVGGDAVAAAQLFIYAFHLPVFTLICGYFSRGFPAGRDRARTLATRVVAPYVIFSAAYPVYAGLLAGRPLGWEPLEPYYLTWFLPALLAWRLSTPLWARVRYPIAIALAIWLIARFATIPSMLNASQVMSLLLFFVLGLKMTPERFALLRRPAARAAGVALLAIGGAVAYVLTGVDIEWVHWRRSFGQLGIAAPAGLGFMVLVLVAAIVLTYAFLAVVPARRTWFTQYGAATMYAYLLHGFVTLWLSYQPWYYRIAGWQVAVIPIGCFGLTVLLCTRPVRALFRWAVEPRLDRLFRGGEGGQPANHRTGAGRRFS